VQPDRGAHSTPPGVQDATDPARRDLVTIEDVERFFDLIETDRLRDPDETLRSDLAALDLISLGIDESQADALADGVVTLDEFRDQIELGAQCVLDAGLVLDPRGVWENDDPFSGAVQLTYGFGNEGTDISNDEMFRLADDCQARYFDLVQAVYGLQNRPTPQEERKRRLDVTRQAWPCMLESGVELGEFNVEDVAVDDIEEIWVRAFSMVDPAAEECLTDLLHERT